MKPAGIIAVVALVAAVAFGIYFVDTEQTEEASLPDVDISVEGGNLPEFETKVGDIETGSEEVTVTVPTIDVESPEEDEATASN